MTETDTAPAAGAELAVHELQSGTLALRGDQIAWSPVQQAALAHIGIEAAPLADQQVFMHICQQVRLDPFARQIYMIPRQEGSGQDRKTKWTIQTGIDGFRLIAERHPQYRGQIGPQWCGPDGVWIDVWVDQQAPVAARVGVLRGDRDAPVWGVALFREYAQTKTWNGQRSLTKMWAEKGAHMIAKCAEALALRKSFPSELSGLLTEDEAARLDSPAAAAPERPRGVTAAELTGQAPPPAPVDEAVAEPVDADVVDAETVDEDQAPAGAGEERPQASQDQMKMVFALLRKAGIDDRNAWASQLLGREITSYGQLSVGDASHLIDSLERGLAALDDAAGEDAAADEPAAEQ